MNAFETLCHPHIEAGYRAAVNRASRAMNPHPPGTIAAEAWLLGHMAGDWPWPIRCLVKLYARLCP